MAAIALSQVSLYPSATPSATASTPPWWYAAGKDQKNIIARKLKITAVTAADTATPTVLGFASILGTLGGYSATVPALPLGLDPTANSGTGSLIIGTGPSNETIYVTVIGTPAVVSATF